MKALVNGQIRELPDGTTVASLLAQIGGPDAGIAVARNDVVVRRSEFGERTIEEGDRVEIIRAVAGG
ncbi:MAG: sulfur carrier protein ThiS [Vulcanimicrobiaceae bacterium]